MASNLLANIRIRAIDQFSRVTKKLRKDFKQIGKAQEAASKKFAVAGQMQLASQAVGQFGSAARAAVAGPIEEFTKFERGMSAVKAVTTFSAGKIAEEFDMLKGKALEMGATTKFTSVESARAMEFLGIAGFDAAQQMAAISPVLDLAAASGTDLGRASDIASDVMGQFGLEAKDMGHIADVMTVAFTGSNTTLETLFETFKMVGADANKLGLSLEQVAGFAGMLGSAGIKGSAGGTALRGMLNRLSAPTSKSAKAMREFKVSVEDLKTGKLRDPVKILGELMDAMEKKGLGAVKQSKVIADIFGVRAKTGILTLQAAIEKGSLQKFAKQFLDVDGAAKRTATTMEDNTIGAMTLLDSAISGLKTSIGETFNTELRGAVDIAARMVTSVTKWTKENPKLTATIFGVAVAGAALLTFLQGFLVVAATILSANALILLAGGFTALKTSIVTAVIAAGPVLLVILAISGAAALLITHWDTVSAFFSLMWAKFTRMSTIAKLSLHAFISGIPLIGPMISAVIWGVDLLSTHWGSLVGAFDWGLGKIKAVFSWISDSAVFKLMFGEGSLNSIVLNQISDLASLVAGEVGGAAQSFGNEVSLVSDLNALSAANAKMAGEILIKVESDTPTSVSTTSDGGVDMITDTGASMTRSGG